MPGCCVPGCENRDKTRMRFHSFPRNEKLRNLWLEKIRNPELFDISETTLNHRHVCGVHFEDKQYRNANRLKLNHEVYPVLFLPVTQKVDVRESSVPGIFNNNTIAHSSNPNENDLETKSDKIVEQPDVTSVPILSVSSSAHYKEEEEVLPTSNKQTHPDCDPLTKRIVQNPECKVEDLELWMKRERNWNRVITENCALQKKVNRLQSENRRLNRRVRSMQTLLRHYKNTHAR